MAIDISSVLPGLFFFYIGRREENEMTDVEKIVQCTY